MKLRNKISKKILAIGICTALVVGSPLMCLHASALVCGVDYFYERVGSNHWGRSDLRAYLNGTKKKGNTLPVDTTYKHEHKKRYRYFDPTYYESHFSDAEYSRIIPWKYQTTRLNKWHNMSINTTTDKFRLPMAATQAYSSWAENDLLYPTNLLNTNQLPNTYLKYIIPQAYWPKSPCWEQPLSGEYVGNKYGICSLCKISLKNINFASAASAKAICNNREKGSSKIDIDGGSLEADYGMYLKKYENDPPDFSINEIKFKDNNKLSINYSGDPKGKYLVVQIFPKDSNNKYTCYMAAGKTVSIGQLFDDFSFETSIDLDISNWGFTENYTYDPDDPNNLKGFSALNGYTAKVWLEDDKEASMAAATEPKTYYVDFVTAESKPSCSLKLINSMPSNLRMFSPINQLQCSWGDLGSINDRDKMNKIINNRDKPSPCPDATNQKIYFGTDRNGKPLQFWIADRDSLLYLYQAKPAAGEEKVAFNNSNDDYENFWYSLTKKEDPQRSLWQRKFGIEHFITDDLISTMTNYLFSEDSPTTTCVQLTPDPYTDMEGILWMQVAHGSYEAWYGLDVSEKVFPDHSKRRVFSEGSIFQITWHQTQSQKELEHVDANILRNIDEFKYHAFDVKVIAPTGETYTALDVPVNLYVEIGDNWDENDLKAFYVRKGDNNDERVENVAHKCLECPDRKNHNFAVLSLEHYSPYIVYDKLTDVERQALKDGDKTQALAIKTGDKTTPLTVIAGIVLACSFGTALTISYTRKRKSRKKLKHNRTN